MKLKKQCFICRKYKLAFLVKRRSFIFPKASPLPIVSNDELCADCFKKTKEAVFSGISPEAEELTNNDTK